MIGLDCDRPRGAFINTPQGQEMALRKIVSLEKINEILNHLCIPRTYFICGQFLESMVDIWGINVIREAFSPNSELTEIADHTYSHSILKPIPTRPDKQVISPEQAVDEYRKNTSLFSTVFGFNNAERGLRAPLGYYQGLKGEEKIIELYLKEGVKYISSDLRNELNSIHVQLVDEYNNIRQPYYYKCGLLEIPSHGWHDTAFSNNSKTPIYEKCPACLEEIKNYYENLICHALSLSCSLGKKIFLGFVMHPYDISFYDMGNQLFYYLNNLQLTNRIQFCTYQDALNWYKNNQ